MESGWNGRTMPLRSLMSLPETKVKNQIYIFEVNSRISSWSKEIVLSFIPVNECECFKNSPSSMTACLPFVFSSLRGFSLETTTCRLPRAAQNLRAWFWLDSYYFQSVHYIEVFNGDKEIRPRIPLVFWKDGSWAWFQQTSIHFCSQSWAPCTKLCLPSPASSPFSTLIEFCKGLIHDYTSLNFYVGRMVYPLCQLVSSRIIACPSPATNWPPRNLASTHIVLMSCPNES